MTFIGNLLTGFAHWWGTITWGTADGWAGAILTSGTLFIAVMLLRNDRRLARRRAADGLSTWVFGGFDGKPGPILEGGDPFYNPYITLHAYNSGASPIPLVRFVYRDGDEPKSVSVRDKRKRGTIQPNSKARARVYIDSVPKWKKNQMFVEIRDPDNNLWYRDVMTNEYISRRKAKRLFARNPSIVRAERRAFEIESAAKRKAFEEEMAEWDRQHEEESGS